MSVIQIQCLKEYFIPFAKINIDWKRDKRYPEQAIQRFITFNRDVFSFLGVSANIDEVNYEKGIRLVASNFIGAAPLRTPSSGKYYTDIHVIPRFGENISELAYLLKDTLEPEYIDKTLYQSDQMRAPFYFDCINYFNSFLTALNDPWNKFDSKIKTESNPCSSTDWLKYIQKSINPSNTLKFENRKNILSREHKEWQELTYMLNIAICEFESFRTPALIKQRYFSIVATLKKYISEHQSVKPMATFQIRAFDTPKIKKLKENANKLLAHNSTNSKSWRIDSAELFERYVQYILRQVGDICGAHIMCNKKISIAGEHRPTWVLRYLEPDIVLHKENKFYFADAKYKAHMLNVHSSSTDLKDTFRSDLHQILAYSSFDSTKNKTVILVYPCNKFKNIKLEAVNNIGNVRNQVFLIGLPFTTVGLDTFINQLSEILKN